MMDIRKLIDTTNPFFVDTHMRREAEYRRHVIATTHGREREKLISQSKRRTRQLEQAHQDWMFSDGRADLLYGEDA